MRSAPRPASAVEKRKGPSRAGGGRERLVREVEARWCALTSAMAVFHALLGEQRGLTSTDLQAVDVLSRKGTLCASELADECGLTRGAVTGMLHRLERAGVASRTRDVGDARRLIISATADPAGCDCRLPEAFRRVIDSFGERELDAIRRFLDESARALHAAACSMRIATRRPPAAKRRRHVREVHGTR